MAFLIRPADDTDLPALIEQFLALNRHEDANSHDRRTDVAGATDALDAALRNVGEKEGVALVAEHAGAVVAHLFLTIETDCVYIRDRERRYGYIAELFVRETARRRGIGRALMNEAERICVARGLARLSVGVLAGNALAAELYARQGFEAYALQLSKSI